MLQWDESYSIKIGETEPITVNSPLPDAASHADHHRQLLHTERPQVGNFIRHASSLGELNRGIHKQIISRGQGQQCAIRFRDASNRDIFAAIGTNVTWLTLAIIAVNPRAPREPSPAAFNAGARNGTSADT
jgi:hypothetical protein